MNPRGLVLMALGVLVLAQVFRGEALQRLGVL